MGLNAWQQFRILYRHFLARLIDLEILAAEGDPQKLFVQFAGLLCAASLVLAIYMVPKYGLSELPPNRLAVAALGDQEFLIALTMAVAGMFAAVAWDAMFPDRRDSFVLSALPVRTRTVFLAKTLAVASGVGLSVLAINVATGLLYPFVPIHSGSGYLSVLRTVAAYWGTVVAAGLFVFCALLGLQGVAAVLLPYRVFGRVTSFLQIAAFFAILGNFFLAPGSSEMSVTDPENRDLAMHFPSFWFLGLFQRWNGPVDGVFAGLAARALSALAIAASVAVATYAIAYFRIVRQAIEQPDIAPAQKRAFAARWMTSLVNRFERKPLDRAVLLFTARTLARSRQHRAILAAYLGVGLAIAVANAKTLLYSDSKLYSMYRRYLSVPLWREPNAALLAAGFVILALTVTGTRAVFSLPVALRANWVFRITAVHSPKAYFIAVRRAVYRLIGMPVWLGLVCSYLLIWPAEGALRQGAVLALAGVVFIERSLYEFRKVPFACSYLPGKSDMKWKLVLYGTAFLFLMDVGSGIERWSMESRSRFVLILAIVGAVAARSHVRWKRFAEAGHQGLQFEDIEIADVAPLDLRRDGAWGRERYIDVENPEPPGAWGKRLGRLAWKTAAVTAVVLAIGTAYEQYGRWQHKRRFPQIGRSYDVGGRSLNLYCSGEGEPAVIFESGKGGPGYMWVFVQREVAKFTRACWYDRAGYGWSDAAPFPHTAAAIAEDLHRLLRAASVPGPYVLVGASFGGFCVRAYKGLHPEEVAGMVLVDSSHVDERGPIPAVGSQDYSVGFVHSVSLLAQFLREVGILRVLMDRDEGRPPVGFTARDDEIANSFEPRTMAEASKELFNESAREARGSGDLGDRPLVVLTAGRPIKAAHDPAGVREALRLQSWWIQIQGQLARHSTRGRQVLLENSRHCISCDAPEEVIGAVRELVGDVRGEGTARFSVDSTTRVDGHKTGRR